MVEEFYGAEYALFRDELTGTRSLGKVLAAVDDEAKRAKILNNMGEALLAVTEKPALLRLNFVHHVLAEYVAHADEHGLRR